MIDYSSSICQSSTVQCRLSNGFGSNTPMVRDGGSTDVDLGGGWWSGCGGVVVVVVVVMVVVVVKWWSH